MGKIINPGIAKQFLTGCAEGVIIACAVAHLLQLHHPPRWA